MLAFTARLLEGLLFGVQPADPVTIALVAAVFGTVALAAAWVPALRATRVDPIQALRMRVDAGSTSRLAVPRPVPKQRRERSERWRHGEHLTARLDREPRRAANPSTGL